MICVDLTQAKPPALRSAPSVAAIATRTAELVAKQIEVDHLRAMLAKLRRHDGGVAMDIDRQRIAAVRTLEALGCGYQGGESAMGLVPTTF